MTPQAAQHVLTKEPQPIADQWMGRCSCGWRTTASFYDHPDREALLYVLERRHAEHVEKEISE